MKNIGLILQLLTILGPRFKEILPIIISIINDLKGVGGNAPVPGFTPGPMATPVELQKALLDNGCSPEDAQALVDTVVVGE